MGYVQSAYATFDSSKGDRERAKRAWLTMRNNSKEKMHINVVVIGHVDSGKSTTTGESPQSCLHLTLPYSLSQAT